MEIELKNGERLILEVSSLTLEYVQDYEGGFEQLVKDAKIKSMYAVNQLLYAIVASNYDKPLTYRQAVRLVKLEDIDKIMQFIIDNTPKINNEKQTRHTHRM
ncbi:MAG: hypothetical protein HFJ48_06000 [Clostridia bacterium]|nr:hypothetical protein [Clostridia bacterium]